MSGYLLDTNVVSLLVPSEGRRDIDEQVIAWIEAKTDALWLSAITISEIRSGIAKAERLGAFRKAQLLEAWWIEIIEFWSAKILPFDRNVADEAGRLMDRADARAFQRFFETRNGSNLLF